MDVFTLQNPYLRMRVTSLSAAVLSLDNRDDNQPVLRPWRENGHFHAGDSALFPMLPLANRVAGNCYVQGRSVIHLPGKAGSPDGFLHGNGWLKRWEVSDCQPDALTLQVSAREACGFDYHARLTYALAAQRVSAKLVITHCGSTPMLYGAGFHPFFAKTPQTRLHFSASGYWPEDERHLPLDWTPVLPDALDFSTPRIPGAQWINNGFSGWSGTARLLSAGREVMLQSDALWLMVYQTQESDFLCLEPQTHPVNAHNMPGQPGLRLLANGERVTCEMTIDVR